MYPTEARILSDLYLEEHGLLQQGWRTVIDSRPKRRLGQCRYSRKEIGLTKVYCLMNPENQIEQTILHEVAHALLGPGNGHSKRWKYTFVNIGGKWKYARSCNDANMPTVQKKVNWVGVCEICGKTFTRNRRPKRSSIYSHSTDQGRIRWSKKQ